jgi:hypothetical protein
MAGAVPWRSRSRQRRLTFTQRFRSCHAARGSVTFTKDVAPILQLCQNCHRAGAIAPMSLLTYEDAGLGALDQ